MPWVFVLSGAGRRTSLRFYSNSGDLFHAVEVPMSRGPKTWQAQEKHGMTWKGLKTWQGNQMPMFFRHVIMSCPFCCSFNHDAAWSILKHLGAVSFLLELLGFPLELCGCETARSLPQSLALGSCSTTSSHVPYRATRVFGLPGASSVKGFVTLNIIE